MGRRFASLVALGAVALGFSSFSAAKRMVVGDRIGFAGSFRVADFRLLDPPLRRARRPASRAAPPSAHGSTIASLGERSLVIDADSGQLILVGADRAAVAKLAIGRHAGQLAVDAAGQRAYVADRDGDRIWVVRIDGDHLITERRIATPVEPYGVALSPDGARLLVTAIADRRLVAFDTKTMKPAWSLAVGREPRGVAISGDGREAVVTHLSTGTVTHVDLRGDSPRLGHTALNRKSPAAASTPVFSQMPNGNAESTSAQSHAGFSFARNAFAALYLPGDTAVVAYQMSTPQQSTSGSERVSSYGGGAAPPVGHRIAFLGAAGKHLARPLARAQIAAHQPRALAYDASRDILYVAGLGDDRVTAIGQASNAAAFHLWTRVVGREGSDRCGPSGLAVSKDGVRVFCSFRRRVVSLSLDADRRNPKVAVGPSLAASRLSELALKGEQLFHTGGDPRISSRGALACASCHPEGRADGLSWRIEGHTLQTPFLAGGRVFGTHPFKWDGKDRDIKTSLRNTVRRLGGGGITPDDAKALVAFFATLPRPRAPTVKSPEAVKRGDRLFHSRRLGCSSCHSGPKLTNGHSYELSDVLGKVDTPSLIGIASSAPYYHDGSAANLRALLREKGTVHGMGSLEKLRDGEVDDLVAFLETL